MNILKISNATINISDVGKPSIGYLTNDWVWGTDPLQPNGCAWYRCVLPGIELEKNGWITGVGIPCFTSRQGFGIISADDRGIHGWDIIVLKLLMDKKTLENIDIAKDLGQIIVVDVDDFFDGIPESNRAYKLTDPKTNPTDNRKIYAQIIEKADHVITSTQFLYEYYSQKRKNVHLVRNGIDARRYEGLRHYRRTHHRPKIGWVGATNWRSNDLEILAPFMKDLLLKHKIKFHHSGHSSGSPNVYELIGIEERMCKTQELVPIGQYPELFDALDIGLVPLSDVPFNKAKSFIKGLEYVAASVPFVASPLPEYEYLADNGIGRIARDEDEWIYHIEQLLDPKTRDKDLAQNKSNLKKFTMDKRGKEWIDVVSQIRSQEK
jgi:glycosyltransferase involved in cell wall biosynthesis